MKNIRKEIEKTVKSCELIYMAGKHFDSDSTKEMINELVDKIEKLFQTKSVEELKPFEELKHVEIHQMHVHEKMSEIYNIPDTKCIVDIEFASGFKKFEYLGNEHIIVSVDEYNEILLRSQKY